MRIKQISHGSLLEDLHSFRRTFDGAQVRDVSRDILQLLRDINSIFESPGSPAAFAEEFRALQEDYRVNMGLLAACLETLEVIIRMDAKADDKDPGSHHSDHHSMSRPRRRAKKEFDIPSDYSDSDYSDNGFFEWSEGEDNQRGSRRTWSKPTFASQGVIRTLERGCRHLGLKEIKPTNPMYRKFLSYR